MLFSILILIPNTYLERIKALKSNPPNSNSGFDIGKWWDMRFRNFLCLPILPEKLPSESFQHSL